MGHVVQEIESTRLSEDLPLVEVDIGLFAHKVGVAATDTLDLGQGIHDLALAIDVGVEQTQNVLRIIVAESSARVLTLFTA